MKYFVLIAAFLLVGFSPLMTHAMDNEMNDVTKPALTAIAFRSDSCGACRILEPKLKEAIASLDDDTKAKIKFVEFDFSNKEKINNTRIIAKENNLDAVLHEYGAKTGFVVLLNQDSEETDKLKADDSAEDMATKITKIIASKG